MNYRELAAKIAALTPEQQEQDVIIFDSDNMEFVPLYPMPTGGGELGFADPAYTKELCPGYPFLNI